MTFALQLNVLLWQNHKHAEPEILCLDMFWIHFIFNDRLTLILHISGLSTQWQVHMVCFSEIHPNPTSELRLFICIHLFTHTSGSVSWSGEVLRLQGINGISGRCDHPLNITRLLRGRITQHSSSRCLLAYLFFSLLSQLESSNGSCELL